MCIYIYICIPIYIYIYTDTINISYQNVYLVWGFPSLACLISRSYIPIIFPLIIPYNKYHYISLILVIPFFTISFVCWLVSCIIYISSQSCQLSYKLLSHIIPAILIPLSSHYHPIISLLFSNSFTIAIPMIFPSCSYYWFPFIENAFHFFIPMFTK